MKKALKYAFLTFPIICFAQLSLYINVIGNWAYLAEMVGWGDGSFVYKQVASK